MINFGKIGVEQAELLNELKREAQSYKMYRIAKYHKSKVKRNHSLKTLQAKQSQINSMRKQLSLPTVNIVKEIRIEIKEYINKEENKRINDEFKRVKKGESFLF